jgi:hypothetical protein
MHMTTHDPNEGLQRSVTVHGLGDLEAAADARWEVMALMPETDARYPGVAGAYAFTNRLLNRHPLEAMVDMAEKAYDDGLDMASDVVRIPRERELARRESFSTALHAGALIARLGIRYDRAGDHVYAEGRYTSAAEYLQYAADGSRQMGITDGKGLQFLHQWEINVARRHAAIAAFDPEQSTIKGLGRAVKAIAMSPFSESSIFASGVNPESNFKAKAHAKAKSFAGGVAAAAICTLKLVPGEKASAKALDLAESKFVF